MGTVILQPNQIAEVVNTATHNFTEMGGLQLAADLSNVVDFGEKLANSNLYENFLQSLPVEIAVKIFKDKLYKSKAPSIIRSSFEYGQLIQVTRAEMPEASDNQSHQLQDGASYDDNTFIKDTIVTKIFKNNDTWEIRKSVTKDQLNNAFKNAQELGSFMSMVWSQVQNAMTIRLDALVMYTITSGAAEVIHGSNANAKINLLAEYKKLHTESKLTAATCIYDKEFLKYATGQIKEYQSMLENYTDLFNQGGVKQFTNKADQHLVLLNMFEHNCATYLESDTFHNEFIELPHHETVAFWNGVGSNTFTDKSTINVKTPAGNTVKQTGVIGVLFDDAACAVTQDNPEVETHFVKSAQFYNYWFKKLNMYCVNLDEQYIVFYVAD